MGVEAVMFEKVVIYGVGLMGGSLGLALRERGLAESVWGVGRHYERLKEAKKAGILTDFTINRKEAAEGAEVIVVCLPVRQIPDAVLGMAALAPDRAILTDVGSTKAEIVGRIEEEIRRPGTEFVGSHPMCGSEQSGFVAAMPTLYQDATCVVTPTTQTPPEAVRKITALWESVGGRVLILDPLEHDRLAARTSHIPRSAAAALCHALEREMDAEKRDLMVSTGFLGATRTAASDVENWCDILLTNADPVLDALGDLQGALSVLRGLLAERNADGLREWLAEGAGIRARLAEQLPIARKNQVS
ncbi:MAG: Cyclohexadienyl dehydrogenase [bacterium]|nr:Cyclohexadienyl dehydrogenase [bacterium]